MLLFMFKTDKIFLKRFEYFKILKKRPFVSITSLQRIVTVIRELIHEEFKFYAVTDKKASKLEGNLKKKKTTVSLQS